MRHGVLGKKLHIICQMGIGYLLSQNLVATSTGRLIRRGSLSVIKPKGNLVDRIMANKAGGAVNPAHRPEESSRVRPRRIFGWKIGDALCIFGGR